MRNIGIIRDAKVNEKDNSGKTPLHEAIIDGRVSVALLLMDEDANVNEKDNSGKAPLHWAAIKAPSLRYATMKLVTMAELLIGKGAKVNVKDNSGKTPLYYAEIEGHKDIVEALKRHGGRK